MKVGCRKRELVSAMNATEVIDALLDVTMSHFHGDGMKEQTTWAEMKPYIDKVEMRDDL